MNTQIRNTLCSGIGLTALLGAILACTSFSPDDSKIAYPAFDAQSDAITISIYDRATGGSKPFFRPPPFAPADKARILRPQWLADGKSIVVGWQGTLSAESENSLSLALVPFGRPGRTNFVVLDSLPNSKALLLLRTPLAIADSTFFFMADSNTLLRVDLATGEIKTNQVPSNQPILALSPSPAGKEIFYLGKAGPRAERLVLGRLQPKTLKQKPLREIGALDLDNAVIAFSSDDKLLARIGEDYRLEVCDAKDKVVRAVGGVKEGLSFGNVVFSPKGNVLYASFARASEQDPNKVACGLAEIPLPNGPIRYTTLLANVVKKGDESPIAFFPVDLAHDGKTAAMCSTYIAVDREPFPAEDCALFLIDLRDAGRKVTKVPIPLPANRKPENK